MRNKGQCVRSGYCCKQVPCYYGTWDDDKNQCEHLVGDKPGEYECGIYEHIIKRPGSNVSPAFGAGCCSSMNSDRLNIIGVTTDSH